MTTTVERSWDRPIRSRVPARAAAVVPVLPPRSTGRVIAVMPAHDEEAVIGAALVSLQRQSVVPDAVVVVVDNCTDGTEAMARAHGAIVFRTIGNRARKAGALNQALTAVLDVARDEDVVFVMDADSIIAHRWLEHALARLADGRTGAVGGIFYGHSGSGLVGYLQQLEYVRYARQLARRGGAAFVLTGTASAFPVTSLRAVAAARAGGRLPGGSAMANAYYDEGNITEDSEITLAVKSLGWEAVSPLECWVATEVMPSWRELWVQRKRWQRGALENLRRYGLTSITAPYAARQVWSFTEICLFLLYLSLTVHAVATGTYRPTAFWLAVGGVFVVERVVSVRRAGWRAMLFAATVLPETLYGLFKHAVNLRCLCDMLTARDPVWR